jgi:hypothetical protein
MQLSPPAVGAERSIIQSREEPDEGVSHRDIMREAKTATATLEVCNLPLVPPDKRRLSAVRTTPVAR